MTHCHRCGKTALQPDAIHTCTPKALVLADELRTRCRLSESCLPEAEYRTRLTVLHDDMLAEIEAAHAVGIRQERELMEADALLRQALEAMESIRPFMGAVSKKLDEAITAIRARLEGTK
jgi:hypothetical protein